MLLTLQLQIGTYAHSASFGEWDLCWWCVDWFFKPNLRRCHRKRETGGLFKAARKGGVEEGKRRGTNFHLTAVERSPVRPCGEHDHTSSMLKCNENSWEGRLILMVSDLTVYGGWYKGPSCDFYFLSNIYVVQVLFQVLSFLQVLDHGWFLDIQQQRTLLFCCWRRTMHFWLLGAVRGCRRYSIQPLCCAVIGIDCFMLWGRSVHLQ